MEIDQNLCRVYADILRVRTGISLNEHKESMIQTKILKLLRRKNLDDVSQHLALIADKHDQYEIQDFINIMTTNTTEFFREKNHFQYIKNNYSQILKRNPSIQKNKEIRIWSAACSTGQEPLTIAMVFNELAAEEFRIKILGTDINTKVLDLASSALYSDDECNNIPKRYLEKYFEREEKGFRARDIIRNMVSYRVFNLMSEHHFNNNFDMIFCRNVLIYFEVEIQQMLIERFYKVLSPGGILFLGHSECIGRKHDGLVSLTPSVYEKKSI